MHRSTALIAGGLVATLAFAAFAPSKLDSLNSKLLDAQGLSARWVVSVVGGEESTYELTFAKPDKFHIESPALMAHGDGATITIFYPDQGVAVTREQTDQAVAEVIADSGSGLWGAFFDVPFTAAASRDAGTVQRGGKTLDRVAVQLDDEGAKKLDLLLDPATGLPVQGEMTVEDLMGATTSILSIEELALADKALAVPKLDLPAGTPTMTWEEYTAAEWSDDLDAGLKLAAETGKLVILNFHAEWCGPCHMLYDNVLSQPGFKREVSPDFVLVRVDVDQNPDLAAQFSVNAIPATFFLDAEGNVLHSEVGAMDMDAMLALAEQVRSANGSR